MQTSNIAHIGTARMAALPLPVPPEQEQDRIVAELDVIRASIESADAALLAAARLRRSLAAALFTGAHEIPELYDEAIRRHSAVADVIAV
jgi:restriction endonuclease S subunit